MRREPFPPTTSIEGSTYPAPESRGEEPQTAGSVVSSMGGRGAQAGEGA